MRTSQVPGARKKISKKESGEKTERTWWNTRRLHFCNPVNPMKLRLMLLSGHCRGFPLMQDSLLLPLAFPCKGSFGEKKGRPGLVHRKKVHKQPERSMGRIAMGSKPLYKETINGKYY